MDAAQRRIRPEFVITTGMKAQAHNRPVLVMDLKAYDCVIVRDLLNSETKRVRAIDLEPLDPTKEIKRDELGDLDRTDLAIARERLEVIQKEYLDLPKRTRADARRAAEKISRRADSRRGYSTAGFYKLLKRWRNEGQLTALMPFHPAGGARKKRLDPKVEDIIDIGLRFHFRPEQPSLKRTMEQIERMCRQNNLKCPDRHTVSDRIRAVPAAVNLSLRGHSKLADDRLKPKPDHFDLAVAPLSVVQIDHKLIDLMLVDEEFGKSIGKAWLTLVIDVCTRMVIGFHLSLNSPSAISVGMALIHAILPKEDWLKERGVDEIWNCWGFPDLIHADNGKDFRGEMLLLAAEIYNISLQFRRIYTGPDGGHIERLAKTLDGDIHTLVGTTFSNPEQRGGYKSEDEARWTLRKLERWFVYHIIEYNNRYHGEIEMPPVAKWNGLIFGDETTPPFVGYLARPKDSIQFRLDWHPFERRTIQHDGVRIGNRKYSDDELGPYICRANPVTGGPDYIFRYDPSDITRVWFWHPEKRQYFPLRDTHGSSFPISKQEDAALRRERRRAGLALVDEATMERVRRHKRELEDEVLRTTVSMQKTKSIRRERERRRLNAGLRVVEPTVVSGQDALPTKDLPGFEIDDA